MYWVHGIECGVLLVGLLEYRWSALRLQMGGGVFGFCEDCWEAVGFWFLLKLNIS